MERKKGGKKAKQRTNKIRFWRRSAPRTRMSALDVCSLHFVQAGSLKRHTQAQKESPCVCGVWMQMGTSAVGRVQRKFVHLPESNSGRRGSRSLNRRLPTVRCALLLISLILSSFCLPPLQQAWLHSHQDVYRGGGDCSPGFRSFTSSRPGGRCCRSSKDLDMI